jgi:putative membrane protein
MVTATALAHFVFQWDRNWVVGVITLTCFSLPLFVVLAIGRYHVLAYADLPAADGVVFRSGLWTRKTSCTFFDRIQSVSCVESPFDRRWNMQTVQIDTAAAGPADHTYRVPMLNREVAEKLFARLSSQTSRVPMVWD